MIKLFKILYAMAKLNISYTTAKFFIEYHDQFK